MVGGVAGGLVGATGGVVATYGATSIAGTAMISGSATIAAKATEVTALQRKNSIKHGKNGWQVANDCIDSIINNSGRILLPALTKTGTTSGRYFLTDVTKHKVVPLLFNTFLNSPGGKAISYIGVAYAWAQTINSIFCNNPAAMATQRGYYLK